MEFDWDPAKNRANARTHGIDFADVVEMFSGATWERIDDRRDYGEERWVAVGMVQGIEITVVYTDQRTADGVVRPIISARRATRDERETFHRRDSR
ncbi:MAG: BrnT family toxin [Gemmatimonadota bacterium]|nr:BrnT family toxin [Gemmatimonadota bacterium]